MVKANSNKLAVGYIRMSSGKQEKSPKQQRAEINAYAAAHGYTIARWYIDEGISGDATDKRKQFQRMIADAEKNAFKFIICWDQDRFGRFDSIEAGRWIYPLRQAGIQLVTVNDGVIDWNDFAGRMIYSIRQEGKHQFLRDLSRNILRGRIAAALRGEWLSPRPLGYAVENKKLVPGDPREVALVRRMFQEYLAGKSLRAIAIGVNDDGFRTQRGNVYAGQTVRIILSNPTYIGRYVWSERRSGKYHVVSDGEISADTSRGFNNEPIVIEDNHPALVDAATFEAVQLRLAQRRKVTTPHQNGGGFIFTGILKCGKCGGPMYGHRCKGRYVRYRCHHYCETKLCDLNSVNQGELLGAVLDAIEERFLEPQNIDRLREILRDELEGQVDTVDPADLRRQLTKLDGKLVKARRNMALADGDDIRREYELVVRELKQEQEGLETAIQKAEKPRGGLAEHEDRIQRAIKSLAGLRHAIHDAPTPLQRELLQSVIEKVRTWSAREGDNSKYQLQRGEIHLRPDVWLGDNLTSTTRSTW